MAQEFVATFKRTIEDIVKVIVPDRLEIRWDAAGVPFIIDPKEPNNWLSLEVAARRGLVSAERLNS